ncbi:MAG: hypothetical protein GEU99_09440 [Luteitalea sp.]|nr:hypothetical protein [Luteitalea sp.]
MSGSQARTPPRALASPAGFSVVELLVTTALVVVIAVPAIARLDAGLGRVRAEAGARQVAARLAAARAHALSSGRSTAVRFERSADTIRMAQVLDGNGNGLRTVDVMSGVDRRVRRPVRLEELVPGARFGIAADLPAIDEESGLAAGSKPIRFGDSDMASFSARGTATPGTAYVRGPDSEQYAVRVLGATGRIRVLRFDRMRGLWLTR